MISNIGLDSTDIDPDEIIKALNSVVSQQYQFVGLSVVGCNLKCLSENLSKVENPDIGSQPDEQDLSKIDLRITLIDAFNYALSTRGYSNISVVDFTLAKTPKVFPIILSGCTIEIKNGNIRIRCD